MMLVVLSPPTESHCCRELLQGLSASHIRRGVHGTRDGMRIRTWTLIKKAFVLDL